MWQIVQSESRVALRMCCRLQVTGIQNTVTGYQVPVTGKYKYRVEGSSYKALIQNSWNLRLLAFGCICIRLQREAVFLVAFMPRCLVAFSLAVSRLTEPRLPQ